MIRTPFILFFLFRWLQNEQNFDPTFDFEDRGPVTMKGKAEPMNVYFLTRKRTAYWIEIVKRSYLVVIF